MFSKDEPHLLGIDEAGRGPTLGPMVYAACWYPVRDKDNLAKMGFKDSKELKESVRISLFDDITTNDSFGYSINSIQPEEISAKMLRKSMYNLNFISHDAAFGLIRTALDQGYNISEVYLDTVGPEETYQKSVERLFPDIKVTVESKADSTYPIVSAASILAKETRDRNVANWEFPEAKAGMVVNRNCGSGYPADPVTKKFLVDHFDKVFGFPSICRFSWASCKTIMETRGVPCNWEKQEQKKNQKLVCYRSTR